MAPERFVEAAGITGRTWSGFSALLSTTMPAMQRTVEALRARGLGGRVKTIVGARR